MAAHKLFPSFRGISIHTTDDLSTLINQGFTGDWVCKKTKADQQKKLMVMSRTDRGHFFIADYIVAEETKSKGKRKRYIIRFRNPVQKGKDMPGLKFNQNPVKYFL